MYSKDGGIAPESQSSWGHCTCTRVVSGINGAINSDRSYTNQLAIEQKVCSRTTAACLPSMKHGNQIGKCFFLWYYYKGNIKNITRCWLDASQCGWDIHKTIYWLSPITMTPYASDFNQAKTAKYSLLQIHNSTEVKSVKLKCFFPYHWISVM